MRRHSYNCLKYMNIYLISFYVVHFFLSLKFLSVFFLSYLLGLAIVIRISYFMHSCLIYSILFGYMEEPQDVVIGCAITYQIEGIGSIWVERKKSGGEYNSRQARKNHHVVVCAQNLTGDAIMDFLTEFFSCPKHEVHQFPESQNCHY